MCRLAVVGALIALAVGFVGAQPALAAPTLNVSIQPVDYLTGDPQTDAAYGLHGDRVAYRVNYSCSAESCLGAQVQLAPSQLNPWGLAVGPMMAYSTWTAPFVGATIGGTDTTGKLINLGNLAAGDAGSFLVVYLIEPGGSFTTARPAQYYPSGFQIENSATFTASNAVAPATADAATVTWTSEIPDPGIVKTSPGTVKPDTTVQYIVRMSSGSFPRRSSSVITGTSQYVAAGNYTVVDTLPPQAVFVSANGGGVYDPVAHTITWTTGSLASPDVNAAGGWGSTDAGGWSGRGAYFSRSVQVTYPASNFPDADVSGCDFEANVTNSVAVTLNYLDSARTEKSAATSVTHPVACYSPFGRATMDKNVQRNAVVGGIDAVYVPPDVTGMTCPPSGTDNWGRACTPGQPLATFGPNDKYWVVSTRNAGNRPSVATVTDTNLDLPGQPVYRITAGATTPPPTINWTYRCGSDTPVSGTTTGTSVQLTTAQINAGCRYTSATVVSGLIAPGNIRPTDTGIGTEWQVRFVFRVPPGGPVNIVNTNTATGTMVWPDEPTIADVPLASSHQVRLTPLPMVAGPRPTLSASLPTAPVVDGGGLAVPGRAVTWSVNGGTGNVPADVDITPQYAFVAPIGWTIDEGSASFPVGSVPAGVTFDYRTVTIDGQERQVVVATWPDTVTFGKNATWPTMTVVARPTFAVAPGTSSVANAWVADSRNNWDNTTATFGGARIDAPDVDGDTNTDEWFATASQTISVSSADGLAVTKEICQPNPTAADGCDWSSDPGTVVGVSTTASAITYRVTLQNVGNTTLASVVAYDVLPYIGDTGTSAGTAATPRGSTFAEQLASTSDESSNLTLAFSASTNPCRPQVYPSGPAGCANDWGSTAAGAAAVRATVTGNLAPGATATFTYDASVVAGAAADAKACNSVAVDSDRTLPSEPLPVCASTQEADLAITVPAHLPVQVDRPGVIPFVVTNHGGSATAPASVELEVPAELTVLDLAPQGWSCTPAPAGTAPIAGPVVLTCAPVDGSGGPRVLPLGEPNPLDLAVLPTSGDAMCVVGTVSGPYSDPDLGNNSTSSCSTIAAFAGELDVDKDDARTLVAPGEQYTYTITVSNLLTSETVAGATVTDVLPDTLTFVSATAGGSVSGQNPDGTGGTIVWNLPALQPAGVPSGDGSGTTGGTSASQTIEVTVEVTDPAAGTVTNVADVEAPDPSIPGEMLAASDDDVDDIQNASIALSKSAAPTVVDTIGQIVTYTFDVTNTGNVPLTGITVTDGFPGLSPITCADTSLAAGASTSCTATYTVTVDDVFAGSFTNTAIAAGTPPIGGPVTSPESQATVTAVQHAALTLVKTAAESSFDAAGQTLHFAFEVTNVGNVPITGLVVADQLPGTTPVVCAATSLQPGASTDCTATYQTTSNDLDNGEVVNTATVSGQAPGGPVTSDPSTVTVPADITPAVSVVKTAAEGSFTAEGTTLHYTFTITNTGNVTLTGVTVNDPLPGLSAIDCPSSVLPAGASQPCTATYVTSQADVDAGGVTNTATATGNPPNGPAVTSPPSTETVPAALQPAIAIVKTVDADQLTSAGQILTYTFEVTNTGNVTLTGIAVVEEMAGVSPVDCPATTLAPSASMTCTATYTVTQTDIDTADQLINRATATGQPPTGEPIESDPSSAPVPPVVLPDISITKDADETSYDAAGQTLHFTFDVTNTGNVTLHGVTVNDPLPGISTVTCAATTLAPGAATSCAASYTVTQADVDNGELVNTATATALTPGGQPATSDPDEVNVTADQAPDVTFTKDADETSYDTAGDMLHFTFEVTNTGNVTLGSITITDALPGVSVVSCPDFLLAPDATTTCTATYTVTQADIDGGSIVNDADLTVTAPDGEVLERNASVEVSADQQPAIGLVKTAAETSFDTAGDELHYTFTVTNTGNVTLDGIVVDDPLPGLSAVDCPATSLAPGESTACTAIYTVTQADLDTGQVTNTATAVGQPPIGDPVTSDPSTAAVPPVLNPALTVTKTTNTPTFTTGAEITYTFTVTNTGNVTLDGVTVNDPLPGLSAVSCPPGTLAPGASKTCTASYTATQADFDAGQIVNTATASAQSPDGDSYTSPAASVTVEATGAVTGLTIVKTVAESQYTVGTTLHYSFVVTNSGNVTLTGVTIHDPMAGLSAVSCADTTLAPAASTTCTATYTVTQADVDAGRIINTATAAASSIGSATLVSEPSTVEVQAVVPVPPPPSDRPTTVPDPGELPATGGNTVPLTATAVGLLVAGVVLVLVRRRFRSA